MPGTTEYIESYFQQTLSNEERSVFESRLETDETFAKEVALYITARQALRETLLQQKTQQWKTEEVATPEETPIIPISKRTSFTRWLTYAAAACVLLVAAMFLFETTTSPKTLAANYVKTKYVHLSQEMGADTDDMVKGMSAYNNKDYAAALPYFKSVEKNDPTNSDVKKFTGLTYLQLKDYDKAIQQFDELAAIKLEFNSGDFLKAVALLERDNDGDKEAAKTLLDKVATNKEVDYEQADEWRKKF